MLCEKCGKNNATTHIKTVVNGVVHEMNLCSSCASQGGYTNIAHNSLVSMLASVLGEGAGVIGGTAPKCPVCGSQFSQIAKNGKVGCAECYNTFSSQLIPYLKRVHGSVKHIGKVPNSAPLAVIPENDNLENLKMQLSRAISEERYEDAAVLRDQIKEGEAKKDE